MTDAVVLNGQQNRVVTTLKRQEDASRAVREGVFHGIGRQFIDDQAYRDGLVGIDQQGLGLHQDFNVGGLADEAGVNAGRYAAQVGLNRNGAQGGRLRDDVVQFCNSGDPGLHRAIAVDAGFSRSSNLEGYEGGDDLQAVLDAVRELGGQDVPVTFHQPGLCHIFKHDQKTGDVISRSVNLACVDLEDAASQCGELVFDLEPVERPLVGHDLVQQGAQGGYIPLAFAEILERTGHDLRLRDLEEVQKGAIDARDRHIPFEDHHRVAHRVDDGLRQAPGALAFARGFAFGRDVVDRQQKIGRVVFCGRKLARIQRKDASPDVGKIMLDFKGVQRMILRHDPLKTVAKRGNVPMTVPKIE
ncbi:hypothetical protein D3C86_1110810 [compost metagenome]